EARKLGVPTVALIDTDSDPTLIDLPIPGNDDSMRAVELIVRELADACIEGKKGRMDKSGEGDGAPQARRRSARASFRAEGEPETPVGGEAPAEGENAPAEGATAPDATTEPETIAAGQNA